MTQFPDKIQTFQTFQTLPKCQTFLPDVPTLRWTDERFCHSSRCKN